MTSEKKWVCYLLKSVDSNKTYVGATTPSSSSLARRMRLTTSPVSITPSERRLLTALILYRRFSEAYLW